MTVYITKYALTHGIYSVEGYVSDIGGGRMFCDEKNFLTCYHKPHWHETHASAVAHAETMRFKKIESLKLQIAKLESMTF